jgi:hypothetical protein
LASAATWTGSSLTNPYGVNTTQLLGVSCYSWTACTASGNAQDSNWVGGALAETWDGSSWSVPSGVVRNPGQKNGFLRGVSCTTATTCMTVGSYGTFSGVPALMAQAQNGSNWTLWNIGIPAGASRAEFNDVHCRIATSCLAVGTKTVSGDSKPFAMDFNGSTWVDNSAVSKSDATLKGVSCVSAGFCMAVGFSGGNPIAQIWSGFGWTATAQPPVPGSWSSAALNAVHCVSENWCMAAGTLRRSEGGTTYYRPFADIWNGSTWTTTPGVPWGNNLEGLAFGISCLSQTECWIVGEGRWGSSLRPWAVRWTGYTWEIQSIPLVPNAEGAQLRDISCTASYKCKAVGWSLFGGPTPIALVETVTP